MTGREPLAFDALPDLVRVNIFLLLRPSDINSCLKVSKSWNEFVKSEILLAERNRSKMATYRSAFGKIATSDAVTVDTSWMLVSKICWLLTCVS